VSTRIKGPESGAIEGAGRGRAVERVRTVNRPPDAGTPEQGQTESVHITAAAHQLLALQKSIEELPDVNAGRVEKLKLDIAQNKHQINSGRIADRLLQLEGELDAAGNSSGD
jgi:flagellar biosynthesis anti-sigma factor FlgM